MENKLTIKSGDVVVFKGIYYHVPGWMDDQPVVFTEPFLLYTEGSWEYELDELCISLCVDGCIKYDDEMESDIRWSGKSSKSIKRAISKALKTNEKPYKSVWNEVFVCSVEFYEEPEDPKIQFDEERNPIVMKYRIIERRTI